MLFVDSSREQAKSLLRIDLFVILLVEFYKALRDVLRYLREH